MPSKPSEPTKTISLQKCPVIPANATFLFMWSRMMMSKWPVEKAKMSISAMEDSIATLGQLQVTPAGRRTDHIRQQLTV